MIAPIIASGLSEEDRQGVEKAADELIDRLKSVSTGDKE